MVSSWLSSDTKKTQNTTGVEAIKSLLRSLNLNRARLPGTLTFRDEPPGPEKSLCKIVSRISNSVDIDSKSVKGRTIDFVQHNTTNNDSQESCNLNSRTESAIHGLSTRKNNDESDDVIYTGNCGTVHKRANFNAESLETIRKWGSARSFAPKIGNINIDTSIGSNNSQKKIVSACWQNTSVTSAPINFNNELRPSSFINSANIFHSQNDRTNLLGSERLTLPSHLSERLDNTYTQLPNGEKKREKLPNSQRANSLKKTKRLLLEKVSRDKLSIDINAIADEKKLKEAKAKNPYHRIHLSINNYFNSPRDAPLISPTRTKLNEEVMDGRGKRLSKRNITKVIAKRKSMGQIIHGKQQSKKIPSISSEDTTDKEFKYRSQIEPESRKVLKEVDVKITSDKQLSDKNNPMKNHKINDETIRSNSSMDYSPVSGIYGKLNITNNRAMDSQRNKQTKTDHLKSRLEAVLSGDHRTVAKPSEILIPHSVRARHIFEPFANIPECSETKIQPTKNNKKKSGHFERNQYGSANKTSTDPCSVWKLNSGLKSLPTRRTITHQDGQNPKQVIDSYTNSNFKHNTTKHENELPIESNIPVLRSKTSIVVSKNSDVTKVNDNCQRLLKINSELNEMTGEKKFNNRHSKSLRILKELLANTDEENIAEKLFKHPDEMGKIDKPSCSINKSINNIEAQTSQKSNMTQSLQTVSEIIEHLDASTETDIDFSLSRDTSIDTENSFGKFPTVSNQNFNQAFVDAQVSCCFPTIVSVNEGISHAAMKSYRMIETQTSRTSFHTSCIEKKDTSVETVRLRLQSKYVNTERCVLIDSSTGKDFLEIQNFCCETQLTNTESTMFDDQSVHDLKLRINGVESQVNALKSLMNIGMHNTSTDICAGLISSLSNQILSTERLSIRNESRGNLKELPDGVIKAFEIAAEKAQNLHRAIEIYREHEIKKQNELKSLSAENQKEKIIIDLLREEERKSQSLIVALEHMSESEKVLQEGLTKLVLYQEVQFTLETLLDQVAREVKESNVNLQELIPKNNERCDNDTVSEWICDLEKCSLQSMPSSSSTKILPIVYGAVCTLIFWSLQFSTSCEFG